MQSFNETSLLVTETFPIGLQVFGLGVYDCRDECSFAPTLERSNGIELKVPLNRLQPAEPPQVKPTNYQVNSMSILAKSKFIHPQGNMVCCHLKQRTGFVLNVGTVLRLRKSIAFLFQYGVCLLKM